MGKIGWRIPEIGEKVVVKHPDFQSSQDGIKSGDVGKVLGMIDDDNPEEILLLLYNPDWSNMDCYYAEDIDEWYGVYSGDAEKYLCCLVYIRECDLHGINEDEVEL